jgi:phosphodiesterase/alkaline phosphatase D-like protein
VAQDVQWDDHEVTNNWLHERILTESADASEADAIPVIEA